MAALGVFLSQIGAVRNEVKESFRRVWEAMTSVTDKISDNKTAGEERYATKAELEKIAEHFDRRFDKGDNARIEIERKIDQVLVAILNRNNPRRG